MSTLRVSLMDGHSLICVTELVAEAVIDTTLKIGPERISLPTLVSVVNVVAKINEIGYALCDTSQEQKIAHLVNTYYLSTSMESWSDRYLIIGASRISDADLPLYNEVDRIREVVVDGARAVTIYENCDDFMGEKDVQDTIVDEVVVSIHNHRDWWDRMPGFLLRTGITVLLEAVLGIPLQAIVASVIGANVLREKHA